MSSDIGVRLGKSWGGNRCKVLEQGDACGFRRSTECKRCDGKGSIRPLRRLFPPKYIRVCSTKAGTHAASFQPIPPCFPTPAGLLSVPENDGEQIGLVGSSSDCLFGVQVKRLKGMGKKFHKRGLSAGSVRWKELPHPCIITRDG
ncbi:hypothetical protein B296_00019331 [Ensete ventricosum]|uniref:Uncharacterized protein n=1 Tax=Ensete ventricosum TaxID=4639 RepID=A0A427B2V9_ENSVE|nr:hypothetical protein B296_00019331 [Ensete ventricosum]